MNQQIMLYTLLALYSTTFHPQMRQIESGVEFLLEGDLRCLFKSAKLKLLVHMYMSIQLSIQGDVFCWCSYTVDKTVTSLPRIPKEPLSLYGEWVVVIYIFSSCSTVIKRYRADSGATKQVKMCEYWIHNNGYGRCGKQLWCRTKHGYWLWSGQVRRTNAKTWKMMSSAIRKGNVSKNYSTKICASSDEYSVSARRAR